MSWKEAGNTASFMLVWNLAEFDFSNNFILHFPSSFKVFNVLFLLSVILHCFAFTLVLHIVCHLLLLAPCSSVFLVATLTIEILNNMHLLMLQSQEMAGKNFSFVTWVL